jgi:hypothetical protein
MSSAARVDEVLEELAQGFKELGRSFDILAKRQTILFQQFQEIKETVEWHMEHGRHGNVDES